MEEDELRQIREARLRELKRQNPSGSGSGSSAEDSKKDEMRAALLPQLLTQDARERLNRVRIVKPERAEQVEQVLLRMGQSGQLMQKVGEKELVNLLDQLAQRDQSANKIVVNRRETDFDRDDFARDSTHSTGAAHAAAHVDDDDDDDFFD